MTDKAMAAIARGAMLRQGGHVIAGVSGGADSVALLHFLWAHAANFGITVTAAHINHGLRGEESDCDEQFVRALCGRLGVPLEVLALHDLAQQAKQARQSLEEHARERRYRFFEELALQTPGAKIATAHTQDDSIETTLFHMARGTGLRGLRGIPPVRGNVIRPLILCTRREIEGYCAENGLDYVTDSTNATDDYARNRIRHHVVPQMRLVHSGFNAAYARMTAHIAQDEDFLCQSAVAALEQAKHKQGLSARVLGEFHDALRYRVLALWLEQAGLRCDSVKAELLLEHLTEENFALELCGGRYVRVRSGVLTVEERAEPTPYFEIGVREGNFSANASIWVTFAITNYEQYKQIEKFDTKGLKNALDYDKIYGNLIFRQKRDGDRIKLCCTGMTRPIKKLFNEAKLTMWKRQNTPVIADEQGVVWLSGFGADERVQVSEDTKKILTVSIAEVDEWNRTF